MRKLSAGSMLDAQIKDEDIAMNSRITTSALSNLSKGLIVTSFVLVAAPAFGATSEARASVTATHFEVGLPPDERSAGDVGLNTASAGVGVSSESADANVFVDFGILRASAFASHAVNGRATASAGGFWADTITVNQSGFQGQQAVATVDFAVDGFLDPLGGTLAEFSHVVQISGT